jgi:hypothetical protein
MTSSLKRGHAPQVAKRPGRDGGYRYGLLLVTDSVPTVATDTRRDGRATSRRYAFNRRLLVDVGIGTAVIAVLALRAALSREAFFGDWGNHLYLVDQQTRWLHSHLLPTYFLHSVESGVFYPHYLFYGGSLYAVTGWLGVLLGSSVNAYRLTFVMAFAACYSGTLWTARQLGVRSLFAHAPAILAVSGAYYLTKGYDDGGWPEFVAISMIPLVAAAALSIIRSKRVPLASAVLLVTGTLLLTGSHNVTFLYGLLFLAVVTAVALAVYRRSITRLLLRRLSIVGALMSLSTALNGWFLVPLLRYADLTLFRHRDYQQFDQFDNATRSFDSWRVVFHPLRTYPVLPIANAHSFYVQAPLFAMIWLTCLGLFILARGRRSTNVTMYAALAVVLAVLLTLIMWQGIWDVLPDLFKVIQGRYRLQTYVNYTVVGLVIVGLVVLAREARARTWLLALVVVTAMSFGLATWQVWSQKTYLPVGELTKSGDHQPPIEYAGCPAPCQTAGTDYRMPGDIGGPFDQLNVDVARASNGTARLRVPTGGPYVTNIVWSPVIELTGPARIVGATPDGWAVIERSPRAGEEPAPVEVRAHATSAVIVGRVISALAAATLVIWLVALLVLRARGKRPHTRQLASAS